MPVGGRGGDKERRKWLQKRVKVEELGKDKVWPYHLDWSFSDLLVTNFYERNMEAESEGGGDTSYSKPSHAKRGYQLRLVGNLD